MRYILSALITPFPASEREAVFKLTRLSLDEAREWAKGGFTSAVGHPATAELFTTLLGVFVTPNRIAVFLEAGDEALAIQFLVRVAEGQVLGLEELERLYNESKITFVLITRLS